jgi:hypothetical protein
VLRKKLTVLLAAVMMLVMAASRAWAAAGGHLYRSGLLMSQRLHPPGVSGEPFEKRGVFPVGCKRPGERLLH